MNEWGLIAGATGGFGRQFAKQLAQKGYNLLLVDKSESTLKEITAEIIDEYKISAKWIVTDFTQPFQIDNLIQQINVYHPVTVFVHAAGYGQHCYLHDGDIQDIWNLMHIHVSSAIKLIHALLPDMMTHCKGNITVVSSLAAFIPAPGSTVYAANKAFLNIFLESLHMEVRDKGVKIQSLCPGLTQTGFHELSQKRLVQKLNIPGLWMKPERVVTLALKHVNAKSVVYIPGLLNKAVKALVVLMPRRWLYWAVSKF